MLNMYDVNVNVNMSLFQFSIHVLPGAKHHEWCCPYLAKKTIEFDTHPSKLFPAPPSSTTVLFLSFDAQPPILYDSNVYRMWE